MLDKPPEVSGRIPRPLFCWIGRNVRGGPLGNVEVYIEPMTRNVRPMRRMVRSMSLRRMFCSWRARKP